MQLDAILFLFLLFQSLLEVNKTESHYFQKEIWLYDNAFTFISYQYSTNIKLEKQVGMKSFQIYRKLFLFQIFLYQVESQIPNYAQLYF